MAAKKKALHIGAGMVGRCVVHNLLPYFDVRVLDMSDENLEETKKLYPSVEVVKGSALDKEVVSKASEDCDIITAAMPGTIGYKVTKLAIELGKRSPAFPL